MLHEIPKFPNVHYPTQPKRLLQMLWTLALTLWALAILRSCCRRWHVVVVLMMSSTDFLKRRALLTTGSKHLPLSFEKSGIARMCWTTPCWLPGQVWLMAVTFQLWVTCENHHGKHVVLISNMASMVVNQNWWWPFTFYWCWMDGKFQQNQ